jgi:hypothetical protein
MRLTIRKSEHIPDWYVIEPVEPNERWADAAVEGYSYEMVAIAEAIDNRDEARFTRCMVVANIEPVLFLSPRNSSGADGEATREEALDLSRQIHELLGYTPSHPKAVPPAARGTSNSGDFSIGSKVWPGTSKLIEEMGELQQVLGKLIAIAGATDHWSGDLRKMLVEELGDVSAAVRFFARMNLTTEELTFVAIRSDNKLAKYDEWQLDPKPPVATTPPPCTDPTCPEHCSDVMGLPDDQGSTDPPVAVTKVESKQPDYTDPPARVDDRTHEERESVPAPKPTGTLDRIVARYGKGDATEQLRAAVLDEVIGALDAFLREPLRSAPESSPLDGGDPAPRECSASMTLSDGFRERALARIRALKGVT